MQRWSRLHASDCTAACHSFLSDLACRTSTHAGGQHPVVALHAGVSPDNDACIAAAVGIIQQSPPAEPVPSALYARGDVAALALS